jgi:hypothetical protein
VFAHISQFRALTLKQERFNDLCLKLAEKTPPTPGDSADGGYRNSPDAYQDAEGEVSGRIKLVTCWHAIGHPVGTFLRCLYKILISIRTMLLCHRLL